MHRAPLEVLLLAASLATQQPSALFLGDQAVPQDILVSGDTVHLFTLQSGSILTRTILYHRSIDGGRTFEPVRNLATNVFEPFAANTNLVGDGDHLLYSIASAGGPVVVASSDGGATWSPPIAIAQPRAPTSAKLFLAGGVTFAVWTEQRIGISDVYVARSLDHGATWLPDVRVDTAAVDANSSYPRVFGDAAAVYVEWTEVQPTLFSWQLQVTHDLGASWLPVPHPLPTGPGAIAANGSIVATAFGSVLHYSGDAGATWTPSAFQPGPATNPVIAFDGPSGLAAWVAGNQVFTAVSHDFGISWTPHGNNLLPVGSLFVSWVWPTVHGGAAALALQFQVSSNPARYGTQVLVSGDLGSTWRATSVFMPTSTGPEVLVRPYQVDQTLFVCTKVAFNAVRATVVCGYQPYGTASPGSGGIEPRLVHAGVPVLGLPIVWTVDQCLGGAPVVLAYSFAGPAVLPWSGINILLGPPLELLLQFSAGPVGVPGAGSTSYGFVLPELPVLIGVRTNWQAAVLDVGMPLGVAATAGVEMWMN